MWIGSSSKNKSMPLEFECPKEPIKFLGTFLSHDAVSNNKNNFFIKIRKMETKLNIWLSRDLTLFGRTMLAKSLGLSQLVYVASINALCPRSSDSRDSEETICVFVEE